MKIAIIGAGISGLTAAYRLRRRHEITVFEANDYAGGHAQTVPVEIAGERRAVDTGFIVYNRVNYPHFAALLRELGVATQPTTMSFSVRDDRCGLEYNGASLNRLFAQRRNLLRPRFYRLVRDILRFYREAPGLAGVEGDQTTVAEYVKANGYSREFAEQYLTPLGAALWSTPAGSFRRFPIRFVVEFLANHAMLQTNGRPTWRTVRGGSQRYVERLTASFRDRIRLKTPVASVERTATHIRLRDGAGGEGRFDQVVFACHADQALRILRDPQPAEADTLRAFPYQANEAILHTDVRPLPRQRRAWASWNYRILRGDSDRVAVTYSMNLLQRLPPEPILNVTLNHDDEIEPSRILQRIAYRHPVFTTERTAAQSRHRELIGANRTSYCGAYWGYGFHEDGVRSALAVCRLLAPEEAAA